MLAKYFSIIRKLCVIWFIRKESSHFTTKHASRCFSNEFSLYYWQESFDGDSFVGQSRFGAYAMLVTPLSTERARHCRDYGGTMFQNENGENILPPSTRLFV